MVTLCDQVLVTHTSNSSIGRQRKVDLCEFKTSLVYTVSSGKAKATNRNHTLEKQKNKTKLFVKYM